MDAAEIAAMVNCPQCWKIPGAPCWPWGSHLARYQRANRKGLLSDEALAVVVSGLEMIAAHVIVPPAATERNAALCPGTSPSPSSWRW